MFFYVRDCTNKEGTATTLYLFKKNASVERKSLKYPLRCYGSMFPRRRFIVPSFTCKIKLCPSHLVRNDCYCLEAKSEEMTETSSLLGEGSILLLVPPC